MNTPQSIRSRYPAIAAIERQIDAKARAAAFEAETTPPRMTALERAEMAENDAWFTALLAEFTPRQLEYLKNRFKS
jgi:hypothetical protein